MASIDQLLRDIFNPGIWTGALFYAVMFLIAAIIMARFVRAVARRILLRDQNAMVDRTIVLFLTQLAQIAVYITALIIYFHIIPALNHLGTALLTGVSVASVVFGLAAQNTLSNLVAGCTLLLYRPFLVDDLVQLATPTGTEIGIVERLTLGYTMLRTMDDRLVIVPNSHMASQVTLNLNRHSLYTMAIVPVGVKDLLHATDVRTALLQIAHDHPKVHRVIGLQRQTLEDGSVILSLRVWCIDAGAAAEVHDGILKEIEKRFTGDILFKPPPPIPPPAPPAAH